MVKDEKIKKKAAEEKTRDIAHSKTLSEQGPQVPVNDTEEALFLQEKDQVISRLQEELLAEDKQIEELKFSLEKEKENTKELRDRNLRLQAEFENFRKRGEREKADFFKYAMEKFFRDLLPVIDNFELALESAQKNADLTGFSEGVKLINQQLKDLLHKEGLTHFPSIGDIFDPTKHEAVMQIESNSHKENTIVEELKKGYLLNDRLLRPALVAVAKKK